MPGYYVPSKTDDDTFTSGDYLRYLRENFIQGIPHIFTAKGDIAAATEARRASSVAAGDDYTILIADSNEPAGVKYSGVTGIATYANHGLRAEDGVTYVYTNWYDPNTQNSISYFFDTDHFYDPREAVDAITIPDGLGGRYYLQYYLRYRSSTSTSDYTITLMVHGSVTLSHSQMNSTVEAGGALVLAGGIHTRLNRIVELSAGDKLSFKVKQDGFNGGGTGPYLSYPMVRLIKLR